MSTTLAILLAICAFVIIMGIPAGLLIKYYLDTKPDFKILGMKFRSKPRAMSSKMSKANIEKMLKVYAKSMASIYNTTEVDMLKHISTLQCVFHKGFLSNDTREKAGIGDSNADHKPDLIVGLTNVPNSVTIAVIYPEDIKNTSAQTMVDADGNIDVYKTALSYELHNTFVNKYAGYSVCMAEVFIDTKSIAMQKVLNTDEAGLVTLKTKRATYDKAYNDIKADL